MLNSVVLGTKKRLPLLTCEMIMRPVKGDPVYVREREEGKTGS